MVFFWRRIWRKNMINWNKRYLMCWLNKKHALTLLKNKDKKTLLVFFLGIVSLVCSIYRFCRWLIYTGEPDWSRVPTRLTRVILPSQPCGSEPSYRSDQFLLLADNENRILLHNLVDWAFLIFHELIKLRTCMHPFS